MGSNSDGDCIRLKHLAMRLSRLPPHPMRNAELEQYSTEGDLAARWLLMIDDLNESRVADLGAGNGILGIGAHLLGASRVWLIEADAEVASVAELASRGMEGVEVLKHVIQGTLPEKIDPQTIIMNPPWGRQTRGADLPLLEAAFSSSADIIHIMHSAEATHLETVAESFGWVGEVLLEQAFRLPATYEHHTARAAETRIKCWRFKRAS